MKFMKQLYNHEPEKGIYGDCDRTCYACLLDLDRPDVLPNWGQYAADANSSFEEMRAKHLRKHGLVLFNAPFPGNKDEIVADESREDLGTLLEALKCYGPDLCVVLGGQSRTGVDHSVIVRNGAIIWDPSLKDSGIVGPCRDGFYWISVPVDVRFAPSKIQIPVMQVTNQ